MSGITSRTSTRDEGAPAARLSGGSSLRPRVGVLGCGYIADIHMQSLRRTGPVEVIVADVDPSAAARLAHGHGGQSVSPSELLARTDLDVLYVCTPHDVRLELFQQLADSAALIVCEKPLALTVDEAVAVREVLGDRSRQVVLAFNQRFMPGVRDLWAWLAPRRSEVRRIRIDVTAPPFLDGWAGTAEHGGGVIVGLGSHAIDLWRHLLGREPVDLGAVGSRVRLDHDLEHDTAVVTVVDEAGVVSTLTLQDSGSTWWSMTARRMLDIDVRLVRGAARAGAVALTTWDDEQAEVRTVEHPGRETDDFLEAWGYAGMARAIRARLGDQTPDDEADTLLATLGDGLACARLVEQARGEAAQADRLARRRLSGPPAQDLLHNALGGHSS